MSLESSKSNKLASVCGVLSSVSHTIFYGENGKRVGFAASKVDSYFFLEGHSLSSRRRWIVVVNPDHLARSEAASLIGKFSLSLLYLFIELY